MVGIGLNNLANLLAYIVEHLHTPKQALRAVKIFV